MIGKRGALAAILVAALASGAGPAPAATPPALTSLKPVLLLTPPRDLNLTADCPNGHPPWMSSKPLPAVAAVVVGFVWEKEAWQRILATQIRSGLTIDPAYINNRRVIVQTIIGRQGMVLVPEGMSVKIGEAVWFIPGHGDPGNLCLYTPNLIVP